MAQDTLQHRKDRLDLLKKQESSNLINLRIKHLEDEIKHLEVQNEDQTGADALHPILYKIVYGFKRKQSDPTQALRRILELAGETVVEGESVEEYTKQINDIANFELFSLIDVKDKMKKWSSNDFIDFIGNDLTVKLNDMQGA